jgi:TPP-dependent pyruvate/acetoin dehydrogenase alpha subunit
MLAQDVITKQQIDLIDSEIRDEINDAFEFAINSPNPKVTHMERHIYA